MGWWVAELLEANPALLGSWIVWVIGSIVLHELAHGWAALRHGDSTPRELGHMTWNPLVHMGGLSLLVFAVVGIAWGQMPINPHRMQGRHAPALVALAGPLMNLSLAAIAIIGGAIWLRYASASQLSDAIVEPVRVFFFAGAFLNLILAGFNLLPVPPLDGYRILSEYWSPVRRLTEHPQGQLVGLGLFALIFFTAGDLLFGPAMEASGVATAWLAMRLP